jgi:hypothetical protein
MGRIVSEVSCLLVHVFPEFIVTYAMLRTEPFDFTILGLPRSMSPGSPTFIVEVDVHRTRPNTMSVVLRTSDPRPSIGTSMLTTSTLPSVTTQLPAQLLEAPTFVVTGLILHVQGWEQVGCQVLSPEISSPYGP